MSLEGMAVETLDVDALVWLVDVGVDDVIVDAGVDGVMLVGVSPGLIT